MVDLTSWLEYIWDHTAYYPLSCAIYDPSCPKHNILRPSTVVKMIEFKRTGIALRNPITYNTKAM